MKNQGFLFKLAGALLLGATLATPSFGAATYIPSAYSGGATYTTSYQDEFSSSTSVDGTTKTWTDNVYEPNGPVTVTKNWDPSVGHTTNGSIHLKVSNIPSGDAYNMVYHLDNTFNFAPNTRYKIILYVKSSSILSSNGVELWLRQGGAPYFAYMVKRLPASTAWQPIILEGITPEGGNDGVGNPLVSLMVTNATPGVDFWFDDLSITTVQQNEYLPVNTTTAIPATMFGLHQNRIGSYWYSGTNTAIAHEGQSVIRLHDTGTHWCNLEPTIGSPYVPTRLNDVMSYINGAYGSSASVIYTMGQTPSFYTATSSTIHSSYCTYGTESLPPTAANMSKWNDYVTYIGNYALANNAVSGNAKIKYFEIWNEWDQGTMYQGDVASMVDMTKRAYTILKGIDPTFQILSPSITNRNGLVALERYLSYNTQDVVSYLDGIAFHGSQSATPINFISQIENVKAVAAHNSASGLYLFNTEGSAGCDPHITSNAVDCPGTPSTASINAFGVTNNLLLWAKGVSNFDYYTWEGNNGTSTAMVYGLDPVNLPIPSGCTAYTCQTTLGTLYQKAAQWLVGSKVTDGYAVSSAANSGATIYVFKMQEAATGNFRAILWTDGPNETVFLPMAADGWKTLHKQTPLGGTTGSIAVGIVPLTTNTPVLVSVTAP